MLRLLSLQRRADLMQRRIRLPGVAEQVSQGQLGQIAERHPQPRLTLLADKLKTLGIAALTVLGSLLVGLKYAAIAMALIGPVLFLEGRIRWIGAVITGGIVGIFAEVLMNRIMAVIWPQPAIWLWLTGGS